MTYFSPCLAPHSLNNFAPPGNPSFQAKRFLVKNPEPFRSPFCSSLVPHSPCLSALIDFRTHKGFANSPSSPFMISLNRTFPPPFSLDERFELEEHGLLSPFLFRLLFLPNPIVIPQCSSRANRCQPCTPNVVTKPPLLFLVH